jgi:hypothetical protein
MDDDQNRLHKKILKGSNHENRRSGEDAATIARVLTQNPRDGKPIAADKFEVQWVAHPSRRLLTQAPQDEVDVAVKGTSS